MVVLGILSVVLMTVDRRTDFLEPVRSTLGLIAYPIQYLAAVPTESGHWVAEHLATRAQLLEQNRILREQVVMLEARSLKLDALSHENARLRDLLASARRFEGERVLVAELLAVDLDPYRQEIRIDKGEDAGVYPGQPLLDASGVMGQVTHAAPLSATAILISDPSHALPVQVSRNGLRTLVVGTGDPSRLTVRYVPNNADVKEGDLLITSGLGGRFPADYPVATISRSERRPGEPFARIEARPLAQLDRAREVLLVWWTPREETDHPETSEEPSS